MKTSTKILVVAAISFPLIGFPEGYFSNFAEASWVFHSLFLGICFYFWCEYHAEEHGLTPPRAAKILCFLLTIVGAPYYLFRAFGFKVGGKKLLRGVAGGLIAILLHTSTFMIGGRLSYGQWPTMF